MCRDHAHAADRPAETGRECAAVLAVPPPPQGFPGLAVGRAVRYLGRTNPDLFQDALRAYDEAAAADPGWMEPMRRAGDLFLGVIGRHGHQPLEVHMGAGTPELGRAAATCISR